MFFNYILLIIYIFALMLLMGFLAIFRMHIGGYLQYSKYIKGVFRFYLIIIGVIAVFGSYMIISGTSPSLSEESITEEKRFF